MMHAQEKPASYTVFGILHIIIGLLGVLCGVIQSVALQPIHIGPAGQEVNIWLLIVQAHPAIETWVRVTTLISVLLSVMLVVAGIILLMGSRNGAVLSLLYSVGKILVTLLDIGFSFLYLFPAMDEVLPKVLPGMPQPQRNAFLLGIRTGMLFGGSISLVYPVVVLAFSIIWLFRPHSLEVGRADRYDRSTDADSGWQS
ncbi:MAG: hypothetical protein RMI91_00520 [Gemmatales bacterium]|nr:hypothetical protein [Gemmatales bacterium]MDW7993115.1 hypothetical protein [Gemmatales bacterium]